MFQNRDEGTGRTVLVIVEDGEGLEFKEKKNLQASLFVDSQW